MMTWPKRYSWTDPKGIRRLVRVVILPGDPIERSHSNADRVEIKDVNSGQRFTDVLFRSLALVE